MLCPKDLASRGFVEMDLTTFMVEMNFETQNPFDVSDGDGSTTATKIGALTITTRKS